MGTLLSDSMNVDTPISGCGTLHQFSRTASLCSGSQRNGCLWLLHEYRHAMNKDPSWFVCYTASLANKQNLRLHSRPKFIMLSACFHLPVLSTSPLRPRTNAPSACETAIYNTAVERCTSSSG